jgi:hypothetical protein
MKFWEYLGDLPSHEIVFFSYMSDIVREEYCIEVAMYHLFRLEYPMGSESFIQSHIDDIFSISD